MTDLGFDPQVFSAMQTGKPYATYCKTTLGKVHVMVISPWEKTPVGIILSGEPKKDPDSFVDTWSQQEDVYFRNANKTHFSTGDIIKVEREYKEEPHTMEQYSDEELREVLALRFISFVKVLSEVKSEAVASRLLDLAEDMDKSEKITSKIKAKLSELQTPTPLTVNQ
jgi:hypothetical protein